MSLLNRGSRWSAWLYALAVACVFLFVRGYAFNTGDQAEHLPQVYQLLDPGLYQGDYFVPQANGQFTVRHYYVKLALLLARTVGLEWGAFLLTLCCITLMAWAFHEMAWHMFRERWAALLAPVGVLLVFYGFTVGGNHIMYGTLISSTLAKALASVALLGFLKRRWAWAGLLLGIASIFQVLVGLQLMLVLTLVLPSVALDRRWRGMASFWTAYLVPALFVLIPTFGQQFGTQVEYDAALYYEVLYRFRNYHHYLPSLFPATHYVKFLGLLMLGGVAYVWSRPADRDMSPILALAVLLGMVVYTVGLEVLGIHALGKLQWFKTSIWVAGFSAMMVAATVGMVMQTLLPLDRTRNRVITLLCGGISLVLLALMTNSAWLPERFDGIYMVGNRRLSDQERMHLWIREQTPKQALFLVSPDNKGFSCQAQRPMPVHFHAIIHSPGFMMPWYAKVKDIYGVGLEDIGSSNARKLATERYEMVQYKGNAYPITFRLDHTEQCRFVDELGPIVHREGPWVLTRFEPAESVIR